MTKVIVPASIAAFVLLSTAFTAAAPGGQAAATYAPQIIAGLLDDPPPPYPGWNGNPNMASTKPNAV